MSRGCGRKSRKSNNKGRWGREIPMPRDKDLSEREQKKKWKFSKKGIRAIGFLRSNVIPY